MAVRFDIFAGTLTVADRVVPARLLEDGGLALDGASVRRLSFGERATAVAAGALAADPEAGVAAAVAGLACADADRPMLVEIAALHLCGAEGEDLPGFAGAALRLGRAGGWSLADIAAAPAVEVDRLIRALTPSEDDGGWTRYRFVGGEDAPRTLDQVRRQLARNLLARDEAASDAVLAASPEARIAERPADLPAPSNGEHAGDAPLDDSRRSTDLDRAPAAVVAPPVRLGRHRTAPHVRLRRREAIAASAPGQPSPIRVPAPGNAETASLATAAHDSPPAAHRQGASDSVPRGRAAAPVRLQPSVPASHAPSASAREVSAASRGADPFGTGLRPPPRQSSHPASTAAPANDLLPSTYEWAAERGGRGAAVARQLSEPERFIAAPRGWPVDELLPVPVATPADSAPIDLWAEDDMAEAIAARLHETADLRGIDR